MPDNVFPLSMLFAHADRRTTPAALGMRTTYAVSQFLPTDRRTSHATSLPILTCDYASDGMDAHTVDQLTDRIVTDAMAWGIPWIDLRAARQAPSPAQSNFLSVMLITDGLRQWQWLINRSPP